MPLAQLAQLYGRAKHEKCKNVKQSPTPAPMRGYKFAGSPQSREWSPFFWWWGGWGVWSSAPRSSHFATLEQKALTCANQRTRDGKMKIAETNPRFGLLS